MVLSSNLKQGKDRRYSKHSYSSFGDEGWSR